MFNLSLRASFPGRSGGGAGREKEGGLATHNVSGIWMPSISNSPVAPCRLRCQISTNQREAETSENVTNKKTNIEKHVLRVLTSLLMSSPPISISHRLLDADIQIPETRAVASSPSFSSPASRAPRRACSQTILISDENLVVFCLVFH